MEKVTLYEIKALYRDNFRVTGYRFGAGEKAVCILGSTRGNENQQVYCCSQLVKRLKALEEKGRIADGKEILVIPCANPHSMNIKKRFWDIDNTDINRMFPGYDAGETTQRIAAGIFEAVKDYSFGIQFTSFYMKGTFMPHVRMMQTGYENIDLARQFGLPYVVVRKPRPFDTATLNYNWQIWETDAFSVYTTNTERIDKVSARQAVEAILNFMSRQGVIRYPGYEGYLSRVVDDSQLATVRAQAAGFFECKVAVGDQVEKGELLAQILDPFDGSLRSNILSPVDGTILFAQDEAMTYDSTALFKIVLQEEL